MKPFRAAVIGTGWAGKMHAHAYQDCQQAELIGISDVNEASTRRVGEELNTYYTTDHREFFDMNPQIVSIATPPFTHYEIAKPFLEQGVHALIEKPITLDLKQADELIAIAQQEGVGLMVGFSERFHIGFRNAQRRLRKIGMPYMAHGWWMHRAPESKGWIWDVEKSGGTIVDLGIFLIDLFRWFFNSEVRMVECRAGNFKFKDAASEDSASMFLKFETGAFASIDVSRALPKAFPSPLDVGMKIFGTDGMIRVDTSTLPLQIYTEKQSIIPDLLRTPSLWIADEVHYFLNCLLNNKEYMCNGQDGRIALEVVLGARKSAETHEKVVFG